MALVRGQLAAVDVPGTGTLTGIYTVTTSKVADVNLTLANRTNTITNFRIAHIKNGGVGAIANEDYLTFDFPTSALAHNAAPFVISAILMSAGDTLAVYSSAAPLSVQVNGIEDDV